MADSNFTSETENIRFILGMAQYYGHYSLVGEVALENDHYRLGELGHELTMTQMNETRFAAERCLVTSGDKLAKSLFAIFFKIEESQAEARAMQLCAEHKEFNCDTEEEYLKDKANCSPIGDLFVNLASEIIRKEKQSLAGRFADEKRITAFDGYEDSIAVLFRDPKNPTVKPVIS